MRDQHNVTLAWLSLPALGADRRRIRLSWVFLVVLAAVALALAGSTIGSAW